MRRSLRSVAGYSAVLFVAVGLAVQGCQDDASMTTAPDLAEGEVAMYVAERVAPYKRVRLVTFIDTVPRAASGKILRRELRDRP